MARHFLDLHVPGTPLLLPNPWDAGSAKLLAAVGFSALATTSSGYAATLGRTDGSIDLDEAIDHVTAVVAAVDVPVSADLENGFADDPAGVAAAVERAMATGLAGCSIEDFSGGRDGTVYDAGLARERMAAAVEVAHRGPAHFVLTARAENHIRGRDDLPDTIARLQSYQEAGADVLFAPGVVTPEALRTLLAAVDRPVNVLVMPGAPPIDELAALGVARISVGGSFAFAALGALVEAGRELLDAGTYGFFDRAAVSRPLVRQAFSR